MNYLVFPFQTLIMTKENSKLCFCATRVLIFDRARVLFSKCLLYDNSMTAFFSLLYKKLIIFSKTSLKPYFHWSALKFLNYALAHKIIFKKVSGTEGILYAFIKSKKLSIAFWEVRQADKMAQKAVQNLASQLSAISPGILVRVGSRGVSKYLTDKFI